ncbi:MAG: hypothetical protein HQ492_00045 [Woeseiaceae bacterium]|nr:hypothetical protein [Woeseiaceae bacterium]
MKMYYATIACDVSVAGGIAFQAESHEDAIAKLTADLITERSVDIDWDNSKNARIVLLERASRPKNVDEDRYAAIDHYVDPEDRKRIETQHRANELRAALKRIVPWLGRMICDGGHLPCVAPNDAVGALHQAEAALAGMDLPLDVIAPRLGETS